MAELIKIILNFSERAGEIARSIRREPKLFSLLVEEKGESEKNQRFTHDFKTLADVLIQEALRHYLTQMIPSLGDHVQGEESAEFTNTLGEKITVRICDTQQETAILLAKVLDGNQEAADILADVVHSDISWSPEPELIEKIPNLPIEKLGIWIDPVDSTGEYVKGKTGTTQGNIYSQGLQCVTVLIGLYDRMSGLPVGGVINQPFAVFNEESKSWQGRVYWGVSHGGINIHNVPLDTYNTEDGRPVLVMSSSEDTKIQDKFNKTFTVLHATGAGYKLLVVALGYAAACVSSKGSTFRWDTGAPHGLLTAQGGGVVIFKQLDHLTKEGDIGGDNLNELQIRYHKPNDHAVQPSLQWSNEGGFVAYRDPSTLYRILECI
ncbi:inositol polyphosphate 1-phosphatase-like [Homarus americanus]|uniref:inositol polyphosphate 1-phosphatase-like n=1 Tax=Homarus americanus TaxID=6706 RepID=UPI001C47A813|nr:inositol polyphosphate 1-phosphatase-like [Homarus americanus]XP_042204831.1 inositol polyphosphate 1-phosphatase-like [Homarus americanus]XP_042204832.1 inositol polyphosphate 1-phosphatase-like [Homarus americanus]